MEYFGLLAANAFILWALLYLGIFVHEMGHALVHAQYSYVVAIDIVVGRKGSTSRFVRFGKWRFFFGYGFEGGAIRYFNNTKRFQLSLKTRIIHRIIGAFAGPAMSLVTAIGYIWFASIVSIYFMLPFLIASGVNLYSGVYKSMFSGLRGTDGDTISKGISALRSVSN